jgi:hypothetical protein
LLAVHVGIDLAARECGVEGRAANDKCAAEIAKAMQIRRELTIFAAGEDRRFGGNRSSLALLKIANSAEIDEGDQRSR